MLGEYSSSNLDYKGQKCNPSVWSNRKRSLGKGSSSHAELVVVRNKYFVNKTAPQSGGSFVRGQFDAPHQLVIRKTLLTGKQSEVAAENEPRLMDFLMKHSKKKYLFRELFDSFFCDSYIFPEGIYVQVLEYCPRILDEFIYRKKKSVVWWKKVIHQIFDILIELERLNITHGDFNPRNILVCRVNPPLIKISDFEFASINHVKLKLKPFPEPSYVGNFDIFRLLTNLLSNHSRTKIPKQIKLIFITMMEITTDTTTNKRFVSAKEVLNKLKKKKLL